MGVSFLFFFLLESNLKDLSSRLRIQKQAASREELPLWWTQVDLCAIGLRLIIIYTNTFPFVDKLTLFYKSFKSSRRNLSEIEQTTDSRLFFSHRKSLLYIAYVVCYPHI